MSRSSSFPARLGVGAAAVVALVGCDSPGALDAWPASLEVQSGKLQTGLIGFPVNEPPSVRLLDADGGPISGAKITFTVTAGGGSIIGAVATTGNDGVAAVGGWTVSAGLNEVTASIPAPFRVAPVRFAASGVPASYDVSLSYLTAASPERRAVFDGAVARWEGLIYGDVPDITLTNVPPEACFDNGSAVNNQTVDDLRILVILDSIDGPEKILGAAGPCIIRLPGLLPIVGVMVFDTADVAMLEDAGLFDEVILHEMGHVLGFGTLWHPDLLNLIAGRGGSDPHFTGAQGRLAFDRNGGLGYAGGNKVPVENTGAQGTRDTHWRESVFGTELMTGFLNASVANPLSVVSVASLGDEGYRVNYAAADGYSLPFAVAARAPAAPVGPSIALGDDVLRMPIYVVSPAGRVTAVYRHGAPEFRGP